MRRILIFCCLLILLSGCAGLRHMGRAVDLGVTVRGKPKICVHLCFAGLATFTTGGFDGYLLGLSDGEIGYHRTEPAQGDGCAPCSGGYGALPYCIVPIEDKTAEKGRRSCLHYIHFGWLGLCFNVHWSEVWKWFG